MRRFNFSALCIAATFFSAAHFASGYSAFTISKIADTNTPIPGGTGNFTGFDVSSGFTFVGDGAGDFSGIYNYIPSYYGSTPSIQVLADTSMTAPGFGPGVNFASFASASDGAAMESFIATTTTGAQGVYTNASISNHSPLWLVLVAQTGEQPSAGLEFDDFASVSGTFDHYPVVPSGEFLSNAGIYIFSISDLPSGPTVTLMQIASTSTIPAGQSSPFSSVGTPFFKPGYPNSNTPGLHSAIQAMRASVGGVEGIYYGGPTFGALDFTRLVDTATPSIVQFTSFGNPAVNPVNLVFTAHYNTANGDQQGIFDYGDYEWALISGPAPTLQQVVSSGETAPGSNGAHFKDFLDVTPEGTFLADLDNGSQGIYRMISDQNNDLTSAMVDVIDTTETLDGKTIASFALSDEGDEEFDGGTSFEVNFTDGSQGLFILSPVFPEPMAMSLVALPSALLVRRRSRRAVLR